MTVKELKLKLNKIEDENIPVQLVVGYISNEYVSDLDVVKVLKS